MSAEPITRESLLAEFKARREAEIARERSGPADLAERHQKERAEALAAFREQREELIAGYQRAGIDEGAFPSLLALDQAKHLEPVIQRQLQEQQASLSQDGVTTWDGFLAEKSKAGVALADEMLAELDARKGPEQAEAGKVNGIAGDPAEPGKLQGSIFEGLDFAYDKETDSVHYTRKMDGTELFEDKGSRIEMKETSANSIETALLLAQERFKKGTPLTITGEDDFKKEAARIAGRLGIPIKNKDLMEIWEQAKDRAAMGIPDDEPGIAPRNGFSGQEAKQDLGKENARTPEKSANAPAQDTGHPDQTQEAEQKSDKSLILVSQGWDAYQHKEGESKSYFVKVKNPNTGKEHETWGVDLERAMTDSQAMPGDRIKIENQGRQRVVVPVIDKDTGKETWKPTHRNIFDVQVADMPLRAAPHLIEAAKAFQMSVADGRVTVPASEYLAAKASLSELPASGIHALHEVAQKPFSDLSPVDRHALISADLATDKGLTRLGVTTAMTNDRLLKIRQRQSPEAVKTALQPGYERAAEQEKGQDQVPQPEQAQERGQDRAKAQEVAQAQDEKRRLVRNEDQQAQEKKQEKKRERKRKAPEIDGQPRNRGRKAPQREDQNIQI